MSDSLDLAIDSIVPGPNPREDFGDLGRMAATMSTAGVIEPIVVRPKGKKYELIAGERRWRAAKKAKLASVPAIVRACDDDEAAALRMIENLERQDLNPLEEAAGFDELVQEHKYSDEDVAKRLGVSIATVRERRKLLDLAPRVRTLVLAGELDYDIAFAIARIPSPKLQCDAANELCTPPSAIPYTAAEAKRVIREKFMHRLDAAPFNLADGGLVKAAGACGECPKRSGSQQTLFAELADEGDHCLDPACWRKKSAAVWRRAVAAAKKVGSIILSDEENRNIWHYSGSWLSYIGERSYVEVDAKCDDLSARTKRTWCQVLGDSAPTPILAKDPNGAPRLLYDRKAALKTLRKLHPETKAKASTTSSSAPAKDAKFEREQKRAQQNRKIHQKAEEAIRAEVADTPPALLQMLQALVVLFTDMGALKSVANRRGLEVADLKGKLETGDERFVGAALAEAALHRVFDKWAPFGKPFDEMCKALGVDTKAHVKAAQAAAKKKPAKRQRAVKK